MIDTATSETILMSVLEARDYSGLSLEIIRRGIAIGELPVYRHWSDIRHHKINKADLDEAMTRVEPRRKKAKDGAGSIRQRPSGLFEFRVMQPDGTRQSYYGKSADEAIAKAESN